MTDRLTLLSLYNVRKWKDRPSLGVGRDSKALNWDLKDWDSSWLRVQFKFVAQSCPALCDPMDCSMPGFHVLHQFLELAQTHVLQISDVTQPSLPLPSPSPPAFNISQHQGIFLMKRWEKYPGVWFYSWSDAILRQETLYFYKIVLNGMIMPSCEDALRPGYLQVEMASRQLVSKLRAH